MALRAKCSGLILGLYKTSVVINSSFLLLKDHHQNAGHEIDQIGACQCVHRHGVVFLSDHQVQKL